LEGDLNSDDLGLSERELSLVQSNVNILVHSAASIQLEADVQHTLRSNYLGTRRLLALATQMQQLRAMVHVSTAYVNVNFGRGKTVDERIYPLYFGQQEVHHADIVDDLMSLKPAAANVRVSGCHQPLGWRGGAASDAQPTCWAASCQIVVLASMCRCAASVGAQLQPGQATAAPSAGDGSRGPCQHSC
jgi:hypothetical protein